ncbi:MAG: GyrI-like domain-containing protein [Candidatus Zixiibacteriota bacterium]
MSKFYRLYLLVVVLSFFLFAQTGCQKKTEAEKVEEKKEYEILTKMAEKMTIVYVEHVGPYDQLGPVFGQLATYAREKGLALDMVGLYYDNPAFVPEESLRCELGIRVEEGFEPDSGFMVKEIPTHKVVYAIMRGPYDKIAMEYPNIMKWMEEKGYKMRGPLIEIYLEGGPDVPPEQLVTEVQFPIE